MNLIIVALLAVIAIVVAPWLFGLVFAGAVAYSFILAAAIGVAVLSALLYAGYFFFFVMPREERMRNERNKALSEKLQAKDLALAAQKEEQKKAADQIIDIRARKAKTEKEAEDKVLAEVAEQIREAEIRKALNANR